MEFLKFRATAFTTRDWEYLRDDWDKNLAFEGNEEGKGRNNNERRIRTCFYDTECWAKFSRN
jgi:hypothetical protein